MTVGSLFFTTRPSWSILVGIITLFVVASDSTRDGNNGKFDPY
jgi:hypothetical protein